MNNDKQNLTEKNENEGNNNNINNDNNIENENIVEKIAINLITIGEPSVGKTSLTIRFVENKFSDKRIETIGVDLLVKNYKISENKIIRVQIWDTAGQEKFRALPANFFKKANGILFVYSINDSISYDNLLETIENTLNIDRIALPFIIVGNKKDLENERNVSFFDAKNNFKQFGGEIFEASAKTGENVENAFNKLILKILEKKNESFSVALKEKMGIFDLNKDDSKNEKDEKTKKKRCCHK